MTYNIVVREAFRGYTVGSLGCWHLYTTTVQPLGHHQHHHLITNDVQVLDPDAPVHYLLLPVLAEARERVRPSVEKEIRTPSLVKRKEC